MMRTWLRYAGLIRRVQWQRNDVIKISERTFLFGGKSDPPIVPIYEAKRFVFDCMRAVDTPDDHAEQMAEILSLADYKGHFSHGMNRLEMYINQIEQNLCDSKAKPEVVSDHSATAWVNGCNGLGVVVGNFCNKLAMQKAEQYGIGCVSAKGSNHFGICSKYVDDALKEGYISFACTNSSPLSVPTRSKTSFFGTNPFGFGAPAPCDSFLLDMATTTVAVGKIELAIRKGSKIPETWALNSDGKPETNPKKAYEAARLSPLGGSEDLGGYKGSGLLCMVEVLCGILAGAKYGPFVEKWGKLTEPANLGQFFMAINPNCFAPDFQERLSDLLTNYRCAEPVDPTKPVLVAGDPERNHMKNVNEAGGVVYTVNQMETCNKLSERLCVRPLGSSDQC